jgi:2-oxoglutarate dehydrogenase E2 component (dihydrolipoamide succinyltransferase)
MVIEIKIPSPGESITEAQLANWFVNDGDYVEKDQEVAEIESDKATLPLIASESGTIQILVKAGEVIKIGTVACKINTDVKRPDNVVSKKQTELVPETVNEKVEKAQEQKKENALNDWYSKVKISPVAKSLMDENNLSVEDIINGLQRITKSDIEKVINNKTIPSEIKVNTGKRNEARKQMSQLRKKLSERLVAVKNQTAMLTTFNEVDMSEVMGIRKKYQAKFEEKHGIKLGFMSFFVKASALALKLHPNVNSMIDGDAIVTPEYADIAIAVQTEKGLMVPILRNAESLSLAEIELKIAELATKSRSGRISIEEMTGGTFTITNGGVFGSLLSTPILNPPQSAILGMHNIADRPVALNGQVVIRPMMYIALSYDHRIIDGKDSVGFLVHLKQFIENPVKLLFEGDDPEKKLLGF